MSLLELAGRGRLSGQAAAAAARSRGRRRRRSRRRRAQRHRQDDAGAHDARPAAADRAARSSSAKQRPRFGYVPQRASVDRRFPLTAYEVALMGRYGLIGAGRRARPIDVERDPRGAGRRRRAELGRAAVSRAVGRPAAARAGGARARRRAGDPRARRADDRHGSAVRAGDARPRGVVHDARQIAVVLIRHHLGAVTDYVEMLVARGRARAIPSPSASRAELLTSARLTKIYDQPIVVRASTATASSSSPIARDEKIVSERTS